MNKIFFLILSFLLISNLALQSAQAAGQYGGQYGQYGAAAPAPALLVDKLVASPKEGKDGKVEYIYVDNLSSSDYKFKPNQYIFIKIKVKNNSSKELFNLTGFDNLPLYIKPLVSEKSEGQYDEKTRVLKFNVGTLAPGEEKIYDFRFRVLPQNELPQDKGLFCIVNKVEVKNNEVADDDSAQFCIEKEVVGVKVVKKGGVEIVEEAPPATIPSAGPEYGILLAGLSGLLGYVGLKLRRIK